MTIWLPRIAYRKGSPEFLFAFRSSLCFRRFRSSIRSASVKSGEMYTDSYPLFCFKFFALRSNGFRSSNSVRPTSTGPGLSDFDLNRLTNRIFAVEPVASIIFSTLILSSNCFSDSAVLFDSFKPKTTTFFFLLSLSFASFIAAFNQLFNWLLRFRH